MNEKKATKIQRNKLTNKLHFWLPKFQRFVKFRQTYPKVLEMNHRQDGKSVSALQTAVILKQTFTFI